MILSHGVKMRLIKNIFWNGTSKNVYYNFIFIQNNTLAEHFNILAASGGRNWILYHHNWQTRHLQTLHNPTAYSHKSTNFLRYTRYKVYIHECFWYSIITLTERRQRKEKHENKSLSHYVLAKKTHPGMLRFPTVFEELG